MKKAMAAALFLFAGFQAISTIATAQADQTVLQLTRNASSRQELTGELSRAVYRTTNRQETYTEEVPYQETVTYTEQVPYTTDTPYPFQEVYYTDEYRCNLIPSSREVCTVNRVCTSNPRPILPHVPGQPNPPATPASCRDVRSCAVIRENRNVCGYERVSHIRTVTRYRTETHYRNEQRTRTETRYRSETRTRTVQDNVLDHTISLDVAVEFPAEAKLQRDETETVSIRLAGTDSSPDATVAVSSDLFNYQVVAKGKQGRTLVLKLAASAKYDADDLGVKTISDLAFDRAAKEIHFDDQGLKGRYETSYRVKLLDAQTREVLFEQKVAPIAGSTALSLPLEDEVFAGHDVIAWVRVWRKGPSIKGTSQQVLFETESAAAAQ